jgi:4-amino-4-deoxy-L-arabinose transferase-like glycosyltransferase
MAMDKGTLNGGRRSLTAEALGLAAVLGLAAWLRFYGLGDNGWGNPYYAAGVRSMLQSWHNFFYASFDPAGFVTVDKPPLALWIQALSARLFGFHPLALLAPQALEGVATVALLWWLVRRRFGALAALTAALVLAALPIAVSADRFNNVDSCLMLVLTLSAWAFSVAVESGRRGPLLLTGLLLGLAFDTKMGAGLVVVPAYAGVYLLAAPLGWWRKGVNGLLAGLVLAAAGLAWVAAVDLTPAEQRPYVGSSHDNSELGLAFGWNGLQRMTQRGRGPGVAGQAGGLSATAQLQAQPEAAAGGQGLAGQAGGPGRGGFNRRGRGGRGGFMGAGQPGLNRLLEGHLAQQTAWLLPLALLGLLAAWGRARPAAGGGSPGRVALLVWLGWVLIHGAVLSAMRGAMHVYYLVLLGPGLAALTGIGLEALWAEHREQGRLRSLLPLALGLAAFWQWQLMMDQADWVGPLTCLLAGGVGLAIVGLTLAPDLFPAARRPLAGLALVLGFGALMLSPLFWALSPVLARNGSRVEADPGLLTGNGGGPGRGMGLGFSSQRLAAYLQAHRGGAEYAVASDSVRPLQQLVIEQGLPVLAWGGFSGSDPILKPDGLAALVAQGRLHYALMQAGDARGRGFFGGPQALSGPAAAEAQNRQALQAWVREHGRPVPVTDWRLPDPPALTATAQAGAPSAPAPAWGAGPGGPWGRGSWQLYALDTEPLHAAPALRVAHRVRRKGWAHPADPAL